MAKWLPDFIECLKASARYQLYLPLLPFTHARSESINADSLNSNFLQLGRNSGGRPQRTVHPRRLPVNTVLHTTLAGFEPTTSSVTDSSNVITKTSVAYVQWRIAQTYIQNSHAWVTLLYGISRPRPSAFASTSTCDLLCHVIAFTVSAQFVVVGMSPGSLSITNTCTAVLINVTFTVYKLSYLSYLFCLLLNIINLGSSGLLVSVNLSVQCPE